MKQLNRNAPEYDRPTPDPAVVTRAVLAETGLYLVLSFALAISFAFLGSLTSWPRPNPTITGFLDWLATATPANSRVELITVTLAAAAAAIALNIATSLGRAEAVTIADEARLSALGSVTPFTAVITAVLTSFCAITGIAGPIVRASHLVVAFVMCAIAATCRRSTGTQRRQLAKAQADVARLGELIEASAAARDGAPVDTRGEASIAKLVAIGSVTTVVSSGVAWVLYDASPRTMVIGFSSRPRSSSRGSTFASR